MRRLRIVPTEPQAVGKVALVTETSASLVAGPVIGLPVGRASKLETRVALSSELVAALAETSGSQERHILRLTLYQQERQGPWRKSDSLHLIASR
jgi:hypothetical protein